MSMWIPFRVQSRAVVRDRDLRIVHVQVIIKKGGAIFQRIYANRRKRAARKEGQ
jgi:hypothetical protein